MSEETTKADDWGNDVAVEDSNEIRRGIPVSGENGKTGEDIYFERRLKLVEPSLKGSVGRIEDYLDMYRQLFLTDQRLFPTQFTVNQSEGRATVSGFVPFHQNLEVLKNIFRRLGIEESLVFKVEKLPFNLSTDAVLARIVTRNEKVYSNPSKKSECVSESLGGDVLFLLTEEDDFYLVYTVDGYAGWIEKNVCEVIDRDDAPTILTSPVARLMRDWNNCTKAFPKAAPIYTETKSSSSMTPLNRQHLERNAAMIGQIVNHLRDLLATRYVWGGKGTDGIDCSGLVQLVHQCVGINLPRDASQQVHCGRLVATGWYREGIKAGDLLFFAGDTGCISHTAVAISKTDYIEADQQVTQSSFDPSSDCYREHREKAFVFAKRLLD